MSTFTKGEWVLDGCNGHVVREATTNKPVAIVIGEVNSEQQAKARLIVAAHKMCEMIQLLVDGIRTAEVLNGRLQIVRVNPVLVKSAEQLLAQIDG